MKKLTPVKFTYYRFPTDEEKKSESYLIRDGLIGIVQTGYVRLYKDHEITIDEAKDVYNRIVEKIMPKEGEFISDIKIELTEFYEYQEGGKPKFTTFGDNIIAIYNHKYNVLDILKNETPIYQNYNGEEWFLK